MNSSGIAATVDETGTPPSPRRVPRLPSSPGETPVTTTLMISIGLFALTGGAMGYAGLRRR